MSVEFTADELRRALETAAVGFWRWDLASDTVRWSASAYEILGFVDLGRPMSIDDYLDHIPSQNLPEVRDTILAALEAPDGHFAIEHPITGDDARERWICGRGHVERNPDGTNRAMLGTVTDVTAKHHALTATRLISELVNDYVYVVELRDGEPLVPSIVAGSFERTTGYTIETLAAKGGWEAVIHPDERKHAMAQQRRALAGQPMIGTYRIVTPEGSVRWLEDRCHPEVRDGKVVRMVGGVSDVTEQRLLEERLAQALKMEAQAQLAGSVAHDFNNILTVISTCLDLSPPESAQIAQAMRTACDRASSLSHALLSFGRRRLSMNETMALDELLDGAWPLLERSCGENITLRRVVVGDPRVHGDQGQLQVLLLNLVTNANQALGGQGTIEVRAWQDTDDSGGAWAVLEVIDDGPGVPPDVVPRLFEPYFTTREAAGGNGMGLASGYGIARNHDGSIHYEPGETGGARFVVRLPQVEPEKDAASAVFARRWLRPGGTETLLFVEDDEDVRLATTLILSSHGYKVITCQNAHEARAVFEEEGASISLLVTDIRLPGDDGLALAATLRKTEPDLPVLLTSGYLPGDAQPDRLAPGSFSFLQKPFTAASLTHRIREILDGDTSHR